MSSQVSDNADGGPANPKYILATDHHATTRLALQHYVWRETFGFNVHPSIPQLPDDAAIADVATGTSLWSIEVIRHLKPTAHLTAFDINLGQAPAPKWLPANMELQHWNMFDAPPDKHLEKFDFVHIRFVILLLREPRHFEQVIRNIAALLKPGGWLQWDECRSFASFVAKADPSVPTPSMDYLCHWMGRQKHGASAELAKIWRSGLPELLNKGGLDLAQQYDLDEMALERLDLMRFYSDQLLVAFEQLAELYYKPGHEDYEDLTKGIRGAALEAVQGCAVVTPPSIWTARKTFPN